MNKETIGFLKEKVNGFNEWLKECGYDKTVDDNFIEFFWICNYAMKNCDIDFSEILNNMRERKVRHERFEKEYEEIMNWKI
jgi:uncharacterized protein YpuA (DUF1002 family)